MKIELNFSKLRSVISQIEHIASKHISLPVLSCILIEVKGNTATFKATNLDVGVEISLPVKASADGVVAVPSHTLSSFISQINDDNQTIKLEVKSGNLEINSSRSKGTIKALSSEDFPTIPKISDGEEIDSNNDVFVKGLKAVAYSASISNIKPELSSVYVYKDGESIAFVATDSFRLAEKKIKPKKSFDFNDVLVPFKNVSEIIRVLEYMGSDIKIKSNKNLISFQSNSGVYLVSRVIDGTFPDYKQIIPKTFVTEATMLKQDIINSLKISNIFSDKFNQIHITIDPKAKIFELETKNSDVGENKTTVDAAISGDKLEMNFNYKYIADCFQSIDADSVSFQLSGPNKPMVIRPVSAEQSFMYLVMPMNR